jgi:hypothetical protein
VEARREAAKERNKKVGYRGGAAAEEEDDEPEVKLVIPPAPRLEDEVRSALCCLCSPAPVLSGATRSLSLWRSVKTVALSLHVRFFLLAGGVCH